MDLYVYKDFELQGVVTAYKSLKWTRRYNDVGEFELELPFTSENMELLAKERIIYKKDTKEAAIILSRNIFTDAFAEERLTVRGRFLSKILDTRIVNYTAATDLQTAINTMVTQNMICANNPKRSISGLIIKNMVLRNNPNVTVELKNTELLQAVKTLCQQYGIGFRMNYKISEKQYELELYEGFVRTDVAFSRQFNNVLDQEYYQETGNHKNTCMVDNNGEIVTVGNSNEGLNRKEIYTTLNTSSTDGATAQGQSVLQSYRETESMDTVIDTNSIQFEYLQDWNLGDVVTCKNAKWGVTIQKNIVEIEEFYDSTGKYLSVVFGDIIPTLKSVISGGGSSGSVQGSSGASGTDGYTPVKGVDYFDGAKGDKGDKGVQGIQGTNGANGKDGTNGINGSNGTQGVKGDVGEQGLQGTQGIQGEKGDKGNIGSQGLQGIQGIKGDSGSQGEKGDKGDKGEQGTSGINGKDGLTTAVKLGTVQYNQNNGVVNLPSYPTSLSQLIDDIGASGGEQGILIFDTLAAQVGTKTTEYNVGNNYVSDVRILSNNKLLVSKTESKSGTIYITTIKLYEDNGTTVKQTITITEKKTSNGYETTIM